MFDQNIIKIHNDVMWDDNTLQKIFHIQSDCEEYFA